MGDQRFDSLDEFPPESLDLYLSTPTDETENPAGLIAIVPASPIIDSTSTPGGDLRGRPRRRRSRLRRAIDAVAANAAVRLRVIAGAVRARLRVIIPSVRASLRDVAAHALAPMRRHGATVRSTPAVDSSALVRQRRRARIRRTISEAAGRDSLSRVATLSQLTPVLGRVVVASSARSARQLRSALQPVAATARALAARGSHATARATAAAAVLAKRGAATSILTARRLPGAVRPLAPKARALKAHVVKAHAAKTHAVTMWVRNLSPQAMAGARLAGRMLHPRSVAAAGAMLALIIIAGPDTGLSDMSAWRALLPVAPTTTSSTAVAPEATAPILVEASLAPEDAPAAIAKTAAAIVPAPLAAPVAPSVPRPVTRNPSVRADPRAIQTVLNRYRDAISTLDVTAVRAVWPSADVDALRKEFAAVRDQNVEFEACRISSIDAGASALCAGVVESGFRAGDRRPRVERRRWQFTLRKFGEGWRITEVHTPRG